RQVTNAFFGSSVHGQVADVFIVDAHTAVIRLHQIHNHIETGGFAGTIGAEQADNLAAVHRHGDVFNNLAVAVAFCQRFGVQGFHGWVSAGTGASGTVTAGAGAVAGSAVLGWKITLIRAGFSPAAAGWPAEMTSVFIS